MLLILCRLRQRWISTGVFGCQPMVISRFSLVSGLRLICVQTIKIWLSGGPGLQKRPIQFSVWGVKNFRAFGIADTFLLSPHDPPPVLEILDLNEERRQSKDRHKLSRNYNTNII